MTHANVHEDWAEKPAEYGKMVRDMRRSAIICCIEKIEYSSEPMRVSRKNMIGVGLLLIGYSALIAGLFALALQPLIGVLMVLCGMALTICSAAELVQEPPDSATSGK
jgi:hypothetical protein